MKLKKKIWVGYGVAFVLMSLVIGWSVAHLVSLGRASDAILRENYRSITAAENMIGALERQDSATLLILLGDVHQGVSQFRNGEPVFLRWLARAKDNITIPGESALVQRIESRYEKYRIEFAQWVGWTTQKSRAKQGARHSAQALYHQSIHPRFLEVRKACVALRTLNETTMYAASERAGRLARQAIWSTVVVATVVLILVVVFSGFLSERMVQPLQRLMDAVRRISAGDYSVQVQVQTKDELEHLAGEFNQMATQLKRYHEMNIEHIIAELLRDITRLKEVEQRKNDFVMAASHELRTPLTGIGMSIDLLLERTVHKLDKKEQELLQVAHEEVYRLKALVNDLLDLSKIEQGRIDMDFVNTSVNTLFEHAQVIFQSQLDNKSVMLTANLATELPAVRVDANKITWVLTNLISNALRYVDEKGHIEISAHQMGAFVHISVRDDGPGIPLEYQAKIFQKFVQVKGQEAGGTGLGLAICKEIVRAHGGTIWVESVPGYGSTFIFTVPVVG